MDRIPDYLCSTKTMAGSIGWSLEKLQIIKRTEMNLPIISVDSAPPTLRPAHLSFY
jgi:hypothetical protein